MSDRFGALKRSFYISLALLLGAFAFGILHFFIFPSQWTTTLGFNPLAILFAGLTSAYIFFFPVVALAILKYLVGKITKLETSPAGEGVFTGLVASIVCATYVHWGMNPAGDGPTGSMVLFFALAIGFGGSAGYLGGNATNRV